MEIEEKSLISMNSMHEFPSERKPQLAVAEQMSLSSVIAVTMLYHGCRQPHAYSNEQTLPTTYINI